ncbi:hypothetical protein [Paraflavitalea sp. CAU 1676]|uniref:hypothetical protein n=1 Tax=Paraflavitalea sp. CAU 1676 TaxID=3032598 RepID=UPI0023DB5C54|nr:hypothetical protein [Paraflavitalea sp. CAU 1676]MDF2192120.1 hypothetical protein [Paraflavitalea sp. CAU 1676]
MDHSTSRRQFLRNTSLGSIGLLSAGDGITQWLGNMADPAPDLMKLSSQLVNTWGKRLLSLQVLDASQTDNYGGILCPGYNIVHGRVGDTIYPFLHLAKKTNDHRFVDGAVLLYRWMERRVSQDDGSWLNEPVKGAWKGTTIFSIIALCDALQYHGALLDEPFKQELRARLKKAGDYVYNNFSLDYGNINYPIAASYGLSLLGTLLDIPAYKEKGRAFAHQAIKFFTKKDGLLYGEGDLYQASAKGCYAVDLGYNVEESLPSLVQYGLLTKDEEVLGIVTKALKSHMEFMLPDGGWDNSWGTRNFKWTYWGSRTSDGCQPAYALMANRDARFHTVALKNAQLLQQCTHDGLLYGGPHYVSHKVPVSVHHTFCHIKALTTILDHETVKPQPRKESPFLPREQPYGVRAFHDIQTWLISQGPFRATVTGYDKEYKKTNGGHATGGALTLLWHEKTGPLLASSMNEYQRYEAGNMQPDNDPLSMPLTPRIEWRPGEELYMNCNDLTAAIETKTSQDVIEVQAVSKLVNKAQQSPAGGEVRCRTSYSFAANTVSCRFSYEGATGAVTPRVVFPVVSPTGEAVTIVNDQTILIDKGTVKVKLTTNRSFKVLPTTNGRLFNFVPGLEAVPLAILANDATVVIEVI